LAAPVIVWRLAPAFRPPAVDRFLKTSGTRAIGDLDAIGKSSFAYHQGYKPWGGMGWAIDNRSA